MKLSGYVNNFGFRRLKRLTWALTTSLPYRPHNNKTIITMCDYYRINVYSDIKAKFKEEYGLY